MTCLFSCVEFKNINATLQVFLVHRHNAFSISNTDKIYTSRPEGMVLQWNPNKISHGLPDCCVVSYSQIYTHYSFLLWAHTVDVIFLTVWNLWTLSPFTLSILIFCYPVYSSLGMCVPWLAWLVFSMLINHA